MRPDAAPADLDAAIARVRSVREARAAGQTWAQIGARHKMDAKAAKRGFRLLERDTRRQFLLSAQAATVAR